MIKETALDKILYQIKKLIPKSIFNFFQPFYHEALAYAGALRYGFPSRSMKVIGVTGTKGKSTTVYLITKILEESGLCVATIGSLGFKINKKEWPNTLKMTMPGRFRIQKFLAEAKRAKCSHVILEVTSEGIKQKRHLGINFDCAVFTNIHREHIESHGSFENYIKAKQELFKITKHACVLNADDPYISYFDKFPSEKKITFGIKGGDIKAEDIKTFEDYSEFKINNELIHLNLASTFNILNALGAWAVGTVFGVPDLSMKVALEKIKVIPGRLEFIQKKPFRVVIDYAHTPDSLEAVYKTLKQEGYHLICVLGAAGGGRDKWKRPEFGAIAERYCDDIFLTNEDPYEENPNEILDQIQSGILSNSSKVHRILDRKEAIKAALVKAREGDTVVITGKGSENTMAVAGNRKITWSEKTVVQELLKTTN
jgi:UDP-N-acetylmuramoyl-L-alanyl-D-glutamate--2,6-diaminopimelate ligase